MIKKAQELDFISWIKRDGSAAVKVPKDMLEDILQCNDKFQLNRLSLKHNTYVASGFNSFVVKIIGKSNNPNAKLNV